MKGECYFMNYQSITFLLFSAVVLLCYYIVPGKCQKYVLLLANLTFYIIAGVKYLPFLLVTMLATYIGARIIGSIWEKEADQLKTCENVQQKKAVRAKCKKKAKRVLLFGLFITIGLLVVCKYSLFILENINKFVPVKNLSAFDMIVPLGVSFYTFMAIGYILDVFWKRYKAEKSFVVYAVFLSYFPHIVQGPIDRFNEFKSQLPIKEKVRFNSANFVSGAQLVIWGFFKKIVIADRIGVFVDSIYDNHNEYTGLILALATVLYSIQIYADFSGCIDIVSGVSETFGIKLKQNFNHPYFSKTIPEFWRRWHISLGDWFKDYVFYPVSVGKLVKSVKKNSKSKRVAELFASCCPLVVVWTITGIWHGAAWKFVAWGLFYAILMVLGVLFEKVNAGAVKKLKIRTDCFSWELWQMLRTFTLCCIGRVFFRAADLGVAVDIFKNMFDEFGLRFVMNDALFNYGLTEDQFNVTIIFIIVLFIADMLQEKMHLRERLSQQNLIFRWSIVLIGIFIILIFGMYGPGYDASSFIYEQF